MQSGPYDDVFVFDDYAVVIKNRNVVNAIYFDRFRGGLVPLVFERTLYDDLEFSDGTFEKVAFWDYSGRGDWQMLAAIKTPGAITIYSFESAINAQDSKGVMSRDETSQSFLFQSTLLTTFVTSKDFLVVGCATCDSGKGWLRIYSP